MTTYPVSLTVDSGGVPEDDETFYFSIDAADANSALDAARALLAQTEQKKGWSWSVDTSAEYAPGH